MLVTDRMIVEAEQFIQEQKKLRELKTLVHDLVLNMYPTEDGFKFLCQGVKINVLYERLRELAGVSHDEITNFRHAQNPRDFVPQEHIMTDEDFINELRRMSDD